MTPWDLIFKMVETSPGSVSVFAIACLAFVAYVAVTIDRLRMFQKRIDSLVTKKDLEIVMAQFELHLSSHFVTQTTCDRRESESQVRIGRLEKQGLSGRMRHGPDDSP